MQIAISGRHIAVTEGMKEHVENKVNSILDNQFYKITSVKVVLDNERNRHSAEVIVNLKDHSIHADAETYDMYAAIDAAVDKIDVQLRKLAEKKQEHREAPLRDSEPKIKTEDENEEA